MIISGKELSKSLKEELKVKVSTLNAEYGRTPNLVVILVGDDPGSVSYVTGKAKAADEVGISNTTLRREATITEDELLALVDELNNDNDVDGILIQLPLPKHIDENKVIAKGNCEKIGIGGKGMPEDQDPDVIAAVGKRQTDLLRFRDRGHGKEIRTGSGKRSGALPCTVYVRIGFDDTADAAVGVCAERIEIADQML